MYRTLPYMVAMMACFVTVQPTAVAWQNPPPSGWCYNETHFKDSYNEWMKCDIFHPSGSSGDPQPYCIEYGYYETMYYDVTQDPPERYVNDETCFQWVTEPPDIQAMPAEPCTPVCWLGRIP